jgi:murein DD-endopeptidase MepM/ murein hydrolase activator NlpD
MIMRGSYVLYRRTSSGNLRRLTSLPVWLPALAAALALAGAVHLAWRLPDVRELGHLTAAVLEAREQRAVERAALMDANEKLTALRRGLDPISGLNGKLAVVTNLAESGGGKASMGSPAMVEGGFGDESRLTRQLTAASRALLEEIAFQETRQRQLTSILRERALEFAARPSIWPVRGSLNSDYGYRTMGRYREHHKGVDIGVPYGTPIVAPADGTVSFVGYESGYGLMVVIEHRHGVSTAYAHLKSAEVEEGQEVKRGTRIAHSGMSGRTTGSHLHYEVRLNGASVDPMNYMYN